MSENVDLVRSIFTAWERGDFASADWADPKLQWVIVGGPGPGVWNGLFAVAEILREFLGTWDDFRVKAHEYRDLDTGRVLVFHNYSGLGKSSEMDLERMNAEGASLVEISGGKVTRLVLYWDRAGALAELGLSG
jgi:ketosteroid isomerase-like protein